MPIKNLSDKRRLPRLGKIHLGIKKVNEGGVEYPSAVDYFVCPDEVKKVFGDRPRELRVIIPVEDEEKWASQYYRCYSQTRGLVCKGDGETCTRIAEKDTEDIATRDSAGIEMKELPCPGTECRYYGERCKEVMNLQFLLPEVPGLGVWQIDTSSINSIKNINSAAELIKRICGRISMIPLILYLEDIEIQSQDGRKKKVHVMSIGIRETLVSLNTAARNDRLIMVGGEEFPPDAIMPVPDDDVPELIIPENQPPEKEDPGPPAQQEPSDINQELSESEEEPGVEIRNWGHLYTECHRRWGMMRSEVLKELNVETQEQLSITPLQAYHRIKVVIEG